MKHSVNRWLLFWCSCLLTCEPSPHNVSGKDCGELLPTWFSCLSLKSEFRRLVSVETQLLCHKMMFSFAKWNSFKCIALNRTHHIVQCLVFIFLALIFSHVIVFLMFMPVLEKIWKKLKSKTKKVFRKLFVGVDQINREKYILISCIPESLQTSRDFCKINVVGLWICNKWNARWHIMYFHANFTVLSLWRRVKGKPMAWERPVFDRATASVSLHCEQLCVRSLVLSVPSVSWQTQAAGMWGSSVLLFAGLLGCECLVQDWLFSSG